MPKNKQITILVVLVITLSLLIGIACTPQQKPAPTPRDNDPGAGDTRMERNDPTRDRDTADNEAAEKAARMAEMIADKNPSVNSATVVFAEEVVYVGIDLKANRTGERAEAVKREVARMVKKQDPDVETVYVTEDADTYTRLQEIARDVEQGRPISGFLNELQNLFKRVTPSMD